MTTALMNLITEVLSVSKGTDSSQVVAVDSQCFEICAAFHYILGALEF